MFGAEDVEKVTIYVFCSKRFCFFKNRDVYDLLWTTTDRGFPCFPSVVRQMLGYSSQRRGTVRILTSAQSRVNGFLYVLLVSIIAFICNFGL